MKATIDAAGRLVIPKKLRLDYGFVPGATLELLPDGDGLRCALADDEVSLVRKGRLLVAHSTDDSRPLTAADVRGLLEDSRR